MRATAGSATERRWRRLPRLRSLDSGPVVVVGGDGDVSVGVVAAEEPVGLAPPEESEVEEAEEEEGGLGHDAEGAHLHEAKAAARHEYTSAMNEGAKLPPPSLPTAPPTSPSPAAGHVAVLTHSMAPSLTREPSFDVVDDVEDESAAAAAVA